MFFVNYLSFFSACLRTSLSLIFFAFTKIYLGITLFLCIYSVLDSSVDSCPFIGLGKFSAFVSSNVAFFLFFLPGTPIRCVTLSHYILHVADSLFHTYCSVSMHYRLSISFRLNIFFHCIIIGWVVTIWMAELLPGREKIFLPLLSVLKVVSLPARDAKKVSYCWYLHWPQVACVWVLFCLPTPFQWSFPSFICIVPIYL